MDTIRYFTEKQVREVVKKRIKRIIKKERAKMVRQFIQLKNELLKLNEGVDKKINKRKQHEI